MKLRELHFDDLVVIPGWQRMAGGTAQGREQSFHADEGWNLWRWQPGVYRLWREGMPNAVTIEGYGASWVSADDDAGEWPGSQEVAPPDPASASPKERDMAAHVDAGAPLASPKRSRKR